MYLYIGLREKKTREAVLYGNLLSNDERSKYDNDTLRAMGEEKLGILEKGISQALTADEKALAEEIARDFRDEFGRIDDIFVNEFNDRMQRVINYVPMLRQDAIATGKAHERAAGTGDSGNKRGVRKTGTARLFS